MKAKFLAIEAILCGAPCIVVAIGGLPIILVAAFRTLSYNTGEAMKVFLFVLGLILALFQYGILSLRTIEQKKYRFGFTFWLAIVSASIGVWWAGLSFGLRAVAMVIGPILVATLHFMALQLLSRKKPAAAT